MMWMSRTALSHSASSTGSGTSVTAISSGLRASTRRHVERDVARPDDGDAGTVERRVEVDEVGVPGVPAHERPGAERAREVLPGDAQRAVDRAAGGVDDGVDVLAQHVEREPVLADVHAAEELQLGRVEGPLQHPDDRLHLHVVGRDAVADEAVRGGEAVEHLHAHRLVRGEQRRRRVEPGRAGSDHRDPVHQTPSRDSAPNRGARFSSHDAMPSRRSAEPMRSSVSTWARASASA